VKRTALKSLTDHLKIHVFKDYLPIKHFCGVKNTFSLIKIEAFVVN
jgi:hypothetical protein